MIKFDQNMCSNLARSQHREWLETNGLGGFASSTLCGMNTRRYHGLLVAALAPPVNRFVLLSKFEETLVLEGARIDLSSNQFPGAIHPQGYQFLVRFEKLFFPVATFRVGDWKIQKTVFMVHGHNATCLEYAFTGPQESEAHFDMRPLLAYRNYHSLTHENSDLQRDTDIGEHHAKFSPYPGLPPLVIRHTADFFFRDGYWYKNFEYLREQERGLDFSEDLFSPGNFRAVVKNGTHLWFFASAEEWSDLTREAELQRFAVIKQRELERRQGLVKGIKSTEKTSFYFRLAADQFLVRRQKDSPTVIAGYPWFTDWGRDTMISVPGLLFVTDDYPAAREILGTFVRSMRDGLIPNRFVDHPEAGEEAEYNTADATLWLFHLVYELARRTDDLKVVKQRFYEALIESFECHRRGTRFGIRMSDDALLSAGEESVQLTWMDARIGEQAVTPRHGKAVEVCALWCNALKVLEFFAKKFGDRGKAKELTSLARQAQESFNKVFWNPAAGYLSDVVSESGIDASLRPNQLFAMTLPFSPLEKQHRKPVVAVVTEHLLTPFGLRTLAKNDSHYRGLYQGSAYDRDFSYHQGTVWPWLLGPYATAYLNAHSRTTRNKKHVRSLLEPLIQYMLSEGVGQIPELFDGDVPPPEEGSPRPPGKGCLAQAWSVAEIHRVLMEEV
ncbi:MAG: glycogen debranching enzyme N-terminal domain-containing protein [Acidobacteriia bacterium]|nr:glycogen debranching enzyme N-terminal domain-containing protein [Terriglobia bacterium]